MIALTVANHQTITTRMRHALTGLTVTQRQALYMSVVENKPAGQIAYILGMPRVAVEAIATAARVKLYQAVAK